MAYTRIHSIKKTLKYALKYIMDEKKTDGKLLISGYSCSEINPYIDFLITKTKAKSHFETQDNKNEILAHHVIQSFSPDDNVTPEQAHEIGKQLANKFLDGKYEYVLSTHIDKGHIHNHIILNSTSCIDYKKIKTQPFKTVAQIRNISDALCLENNLSVIKKQKDISMSYGEYRSARRGVSWKSEIRKKLNFVLERSQSFDEFASMAKQLGVTVDNSGAHIKYQIEGQERWTRGNKLSDDNKFLPDGLSAKFEENKNIIENLKAAIQNSVQGTNSFVQFQAKLLDEFDIKLKKKKNGQVWYEFKNADGDTIELSDSILGKAYSYQKISEIITSGEDYYYGWELEPEYDISEEYNLRYSSYSPSETKLRIKYDDVSKISNDGILINFKLSYNENASVYLEKKYVTFDKEKNEFEVTLNDSYNYFCDINKNHFQGKFVNGRKIAEALSGIDILEPIQIEIGAADIKYLSEKGVTLSLPDCGIDSLFIDSKYVDFNRFNGGKVFITVHENWNYGYLAQHGTKNYKNISGLELLKNLDNRSATTDLRLKRRIERLDRQTSYQEVQDMVMTLNIRKELGLNSVNDFNEAIKNANEKIQQLDNELKVSRDKLVSEKGLHKIYSAYVEYSSVPESERDKNIKEIIYTAQQRLKKHNVPLDIGVEKLEKLIEFRENEINKLITQKTNNEELLRKLNRSNEISQGRGIKKNDLKSLFKDEKNKER